MKIIELANSNRPAWDEYVRNADNGLPQHLSGWRDVMSAAYRYKTHFLMAKQQDAIVGVLPMFIIRSLLVGHSAMTMPGGLCADNDQAAQALLERAKTISQQAGVNRFVIQDTRQQYTGMPQTANQHVHYVIDLRQGADAVWKNLRSNTRRHVRLANKNGLTIEIDRNNQRLDDFYDVLCHFTHQAGTPVFGRPFLENVVTAFPDGYNIAVIYKEKKPVGAYFQLILGNTVYGTWGATLWPYLKDSAVYLAYWGIIEYSANNGYHYLDLGRSPKDSGPAKFKAKWRGDEYPIYQQSAGFGPKAANGSMSERVKSDSKMQYFMQVWPKLPFPLTRYLGPKLRRHVPFA